MKATNQSMFESRLEENDKSNNYPALFCLRSSLLLCNLYEYRFTKHTRNTGLLSYCWVSFTSMIYLFIHHTYHYRHQCDRHAIMVWIKHIKNRNPYLLAFFQPSFSEPTHDLEIKICFEGVKCSFTPLKQKVIQYSERQIETTSLLNNVEPGTIQRANLRGNLILAEVDRDTRKCIFNNLIGSTFQRIGTWDRDVRVYRL